VTDNPDPPEAPAPPQVGTCDEQHCEGVRCGRTKGHDGVHEFQRPDGNPFYWK
jgi:hypothetical protein